MAKTYYASKDDKITEREIQNTQLARKLGGECVVLLKNDGTLPLKTTSNVALFGNGARNTIKGGTGSGDVNTRSNMNIEDGLKEAGFNVTTKAWIDRNQEKLMEEKAIFLKKVDEEAKATGRTPIFIIFDHPFEAPDIELITQEDISKAETDTAIFVVSRNSGEGADRRNVKGDYQLSDNELKNLEILGKNFKKVILVLNIGGLIQMAPVESIEGISSIVLLNQLGNLTGSVLTDILLGKATPSGRLSDTWAVDYMDYPSSAEFSFNNGNVHEDYYRDGIYVGYRYFDSVKKDVVYPFGYGLGYTDFESKVTGCAQNGDKVTVTVTVKNTGAEYSGKEVVQVYISAPQGKLAKPYQELKGFVKTDELKPGQTQEVKIDIPLISLASYDESSASWIMEKGEYIVRVGKNSRCTTAVAALVLEKDFVTEKCQNILPLDCKMEEMAVNCEKTECADLNCKITIDISKLSCRENKYLEERKILKTDIKETITLNDVKDGKAKLEDLVAQLTVEEMATMLVGVFNHGRENSIVGAASTCAPGAAGETPNLLTVSRKIKKLILADGPAGVRLQPHFKTDKDGNLLPGGDIYGDTVIPFTNVPEGAIDYYQYCTAIPIGWALAQSWNCQMVQEIGKMIGGEMNLFGVDLWLAPAQNIHRNPLCGRNFEYYSEDPLLTGKMSAAITNGVQENKGCGTTIKHFCANNQEENRYFVNAHISERAVREIYLKGFEIAVKESQPLSIMTSYNLLNGTHTANHYDLCQKALRDEWGFEGVVMTDWFTSQIMPDMYKKYKGHYPISASTGCIHAGNDLQMPGCQQNIDDIIKAVESGEELDGYKITLGDLQYCTYNFLKVMLRSFTM